MYQSLQKNYVLCMKANSEQAQRQLKKKDLFSNFF